MRGDALQGRPKLLANPTSLLWVDMNREARVGIGRPKGKCAAPSKPSVRAEGSYSNHIYG